MSKETKTIQTTLQRVTADWLQQIDPNVFVTYTFKEAVSYDRALKVFGTHVHSLRSELYGRNSKRRLPIVPVIEKYMKGSSYGSLLAPADGTHIHCLYRLPGKPDQYKEVIRRTWVEAHASCGDPNIYCPNGDDWYRELSAESDVSNVVDYVLKTCRSDTQAVLWKFVSFGH
jgi:hypothetical protein